MRSQRFPHLPPLDALIAFESAAEHESFARAGEELFLTASAIAYQIKKLERTLGVPLFARHGKGVSLTAKGQDFLLLVRESFTAMENHVDRIRHGRLAPVKLKTQHAFAQLWLQKRLGDYQHNFPDHDLEITAVSTISGSPKDTDIAIGYFHHDPGEHWQCLWKETLIPVASKGYESKTPVLYQDMNWHDDWRFWQDPKHINNGAAKMRRSSLYALILQSVLDGHGVMVGRVSLIQEHLESGALTPWPTAHIQAVESGGYYLYQSPSCGEHVVAQHFCQWLVTVCSDKMNGQQ
ncbi:LysR family transcriptional regulator [Enterovibrio calviensis]|uniref:LysR family transcriptional regulator n=1 Tax=Enterovibrio calviensis TaxID=91359 RepID=UPI0004840017|nr:LysR family transcriptional regulator [Enterovibrio calviensis]